MSGALSGMIFFLAILPGLFTGRRYLKVYVAAYAAVPRTFGWRIRDANPVVEEWRRRAVAAQALWVLVLVVLFILHWP